MIDMGTGRRITFDIVVSGCATDCWHCYVSGGRGPFMPVKEYTQALDFVARFRQIARHSK